MPPGIKCRTCALAASAFRVTKKAIFIQSVNDGDPDAKAVKCTRIGIWVVIFAVLIALI